MAGIGFVLNKSLKGDRLSSVLKIYSYAGMLSAGAWVSSIVALLLVGFITAFVHGSQGPLDGLIVYATTLAFSLIATSPILMPFTRHIANLIFAGKESKVLPTFFGAFAILLPIALIFAVVFFNFLYPDQSVIFVYSVILLFVVLCAIWIAHILATGLESFRSVMLSYVFAYGFIVWATYYFAPMLDGLVVIFLLGNIFLLLLLMLLIIKKYISDRLISYSFFNPKKFYWALALSGIFYTLGSWIDKIIFWYNINTGAQVIGKVHFSILYDIPIFLAYLSIIPGMSVFFYRLESTFAEKNDFYFNAIREGATLDTIEHHRLGITNSAKDTLRETLIIQAIFSIGIYLNAPIIFNFLNISSLYLSLFNVLLVGVYLQLGFMSMLALLYYIDRRIQAMWLSVAFFVLNASLSLLTIYMGPSFFGYGFAFSLLIMFCASTIVLTNLLGRLSYETFMLQ